MSCESLITPEDQVGAFSISCSEYFSNLWVCLCRSTEGIGSEDDRQLVQLELGRGFCMDNDSFYLQDYGRVIDADHLDSIQGNDVAVWLRASASEAATIPTSASAR